MQSLLNPLKTPRILHAKSSPTPQIRTLNPSIRQALEASKPTTLNAEPPGPLKPEGLKPSTEDRAQSHCSAPPSPWLVPGSQSLHSYLGQEDRRKPESRRDILNGYAGYVVFVWGFSFWGVMDSFWLSCQAGTPRLCTCLGIQNLRFLIQVPALSFRV